MVPVAAERTARKGGPTCMRCARDEGAITPATWWRNRRRRLSGRTRLLPSGSRLWSSTRSGAASSAEKPCSGSATEITVHATAKAREATRSGRRRTDNVVAPARHRVRPCRVRARRDNPRKGFEELPPRQLVGAELRLHPEPLVHGEPVDDRTVDGEVRCRVRNRDTACGLVRRR